MRVTLRSGSSRSRSGVRYDVPTGHVEWELSDENMPESVIHDEAVELLKALLVAWAARQSTPMQIARNLAVRWDREHPAIGVDPDVCLLVPPPPREGPDLTSVRTWLPGHHPPQVAIEVVSATNPRKDYVLAPDKYAASGTGELWIFDPALAGPSARGGPFRVQVWRRDESGDLVRLYAGEGPAYSAALDAHLVVVDEGRKLRLAGDPELTRFWLTTAEAEREAKESERAQKESERAAKEQALAEVELLRRELEKRST